LALSALLLLYEEGWDEKGKLIFFIAQTGRYTFIDCGATSDVFSFHAGT
jgi:hypothetical protein